MCTLSNYHLLDLVLLRLLAVAYCDTPGADILGGSTLVNTVVGISIFDISGSTGFSAISTNPWGK